MERRNNYNDLKPFRFWCQKVLPLVYDDSLSYYELLDKVIDYLNKTMEDVTVLNDDTEAMYAAYNQLQSYVNNYFDNLDVQDEINAKLDQMAIDGTLSSLINPQIPGAVSAWLAANVDPVGSAVIVDATLSIAGAAADAKATGVLKGDINELQETGNSFFDETGFVSGVLNGSTGQVITASGNRYRAVSPLLSFEFPVVISLTDNNYRYYLCYYTDASTVQPSPGWKTGEWTIPANQLFRVQIGKVSGETSADVADISVFITKVHYISGLVTMLRSEMDAMPPNQNNIDITGQISQGGLDTNGLISRYTYRIVQSKRFGGLKYDVNLIIKANGQAYGYAIYGDASGATKEMISGWITTDSEITLSAGKYILFTMSKLPVASSLSIIPSENLVRIYINRFTHVEYTADGIGLEYLRENYTNIIKDAFVPQMSFNGSTGDYGHNPQRSAIISPIVFPFDLVFTCGADYDIVFQYFNGAVADISHFISSTYTWTKKWIVPAGQYFGLLVRYADNRTVDGGEIEALQISIGGADYLNYSIGTDFIRRKLTITPLGKLTQQQSFCKYNGYYFSTNGSSITKQDANFNIIESKNINVGHGNSFQMGTSNLAYISGWDDQKIYVVNMDTITADRIIELPTTGYTTCVVDDVKKLAYILQRDSYPSTYERYNFIVYDYDNEQIIMQTKTTEAFSGLQGMDLYQDKIIAVNGFGSAMSQTIPDYKNGYKVYDLSGHMLASWVLGGVDEKEPEGIYVDRKTGEALLMTGDAILYKIS